jgi:hypothetical protein
VRSVILYNILQLMGNVLAMPYNIKDLHLFSVRFLKGGGGGEMLNRDYFTLGKKTLLK